MIIVCKKDFLGGFYRIPQDDDKIDKLLEDYIRKWERKWIYTILGQQLGDLLIASLNSEHVPESAIFEVIFNPIYINDPLADYNLRESEGLKNILLGKIYLEFVKDEQYKNTTTGVITTQIDTASRMSYLNLYMVAENRYNETVAWIKTIQWYCLVYARQINNGVNPYPLFYGQIINAESAAFL